MSVLVGATELARRRDAMSSSPDLAAVDSHLVADVERLLSRPLYLPEAKALYSRWGQHCRDDGGELEFDPFEPHAHRCGTCGRAWDTEQSHRWWVYWYQLWLAERVWMMALLSGAGGHARAEARALETLAALAERYASWPNADNVLGPSRPFFSTYLESIWVLHLAAASSLLADLGRLPAELARDVRDRLFRPSGDLIADFDEGASNRQVWNSAALYALGRATGDEAMARAAAHGPSGILAALKRGLSREGLWYEGENYHWFALRGLAWGAGMLRTAGEVDLYSGGAEEGERFRAAFRAPLSTVQPDFTFPARRDSKYGVSLRQRRMAELWEMARASGNVGTEADGGDGGGSGSLLDAVLAAVYDPGIEASDESWREVTEVERADGGAGVRRGALGWKAWLWMLPGAPASGTWTPGTVHLEDAGIAVFRRDGGATYVGLDYGEPGGGHGHADRLHLTLWHRGTPWLVDFGTGSYASPALGWYRSTLSHNAPLVDGHSQAAAAGRCVAFDERGEWGWVCAILPDGSAFDGAAVQRTVVLGPGYLLDVVQMHSDQARSLGLPWHGLGRVVAGEHGVTFEGNDALQVMLAGRQPFQVLMQRASGPPVRGGAAEELEFPIAVATGEAVTLAAAVDLGAGLAEVECVEEDFLVRHADGRVDLHRATDDGWEVELEHGDPVALSGLRDEPDEAPAGPQRFEPPAAVVRKVEATPALDGTMAGFPGDALLKLDRAAQFRRAEEPWPGAEEFSAVAALAHDGETLYLAVDVVAPEPVFRPASQPDPEWENENPDIHSDGVQLYVDASGYYGWLMVPDPDLGTVRVSGVRGTDGFPDMVTARWAPTGRGYRITGAISIPGLLEGEVRLDLCVNRARPGRERRWGQLVWSGARGTRLYLAGDRPVSGALPLVRVE